MLGDFLDKLTSYNLFNYLLPGAVFAFTADRYFQANLVQEDYLLAAFIYYFIGVVISRFGSLILEPILKKLGLLRFEVYENYLVAENKDSKILTLMEAANMYRSFAAMFILLLIFSGYYALEQQFEKLSEIRGVVACLILGGIFILAYIKQCNFVSSRVRKSNETPKVE